MKLRDDAQRIQIYNSGLLVFLYDEANRTAIQEIGPRVLDGFSRKDSLEDAALKVTAREGLLVVYELQQDDELDIAVVTGNPLSDEELSQGVWEPQQQALLNLPSGRLCVESYDSLLLGEEEPEDEGALVHVPPGEYVLTLHRIDWEGLPELDDDEDEKDYDGPLEIIALQLKAQAESIPEPASLLLYPL